MDRDIPSYNHLVTNKIQQKNMQIHYEKLARIKVPLPTARTAAATRPTDLSIPASNSKIKSTSSKKTARQRSRGTI